MGVAILSGVLASLDPHSSSAQAKWDSHTPGTQTPAEMSKDDPSLPSRFLACVSREESAAKLRVVFATTGSLVPAVEVLVAENVRAVQESDIVLLWYRNPVCCYPG